LPLHELIGAWSGERLLGLKEYKENPLALEIEIKLIIATLIKKGREIVLTKIQIL